ncbi:integrator complex subunit 10 [Planococcus citri]|uniref:integrator complex subunit 10 n=1 Tax=Planococcus citri TaxID=170843 RepID=UPI0031F7537D
MPLLGDDPDSDNIADEEYLVSKSKEAFRINPYLCKAWILTAKTLFPHNFRIQFEAYTIEKNNDNAKEAAKCFATLFQSFISESGLWQEINTLTNALRTESSNPETLFLRKMFSCIPAVTQHDILTVTAERSEDTMEHCRLMLLLFRKFPQATPQLIVRLVDTLITAEKHGHCPSVINCYRKTLVCDVLPLLLHANADLPSKQLYRFLHKSTEFYLASLMTKNSQETFADDESKIGVNWESFYALLRLFGGKLDWELCSIFSYPWNKDVTWQHILTFSTVRLNALDPSKGVKQLIFCLTILFAYCLYQYNALLQSSADNRISSVLVEAFVSEEMDEINTIPSSKRMKIDSSDPTLPNLTGGEGTGDIIKHFNFALTCWSMLQSTETYQKEFFKLKQHIRLDNWLLDFTTDVALYRAKFDEFQSNIQNDNGSIRTWIQRLSYNFIVKHFRFLGESSIQVVKQLHTVHTIGSCSQNLTQVGVARHLHYLPLTKVAILQYVAKLLILKFWQMLPNVDGVDADRIYGYLLILVQVNWPSEKRIALDVLTRIRNQRSFIFPLFFKYVVNVEILEEFTHMYANEHETIKLDLMGPAQTSGQKRISTRGADKEEREDFLQMMKQQVCRQEPLYTLVISFLLEEERFISVK